MVKSILPRAEVSVQSILGNARKFMFLLDYSLSSECLAFIQMLMHVFGVYRRN